MNRNNLIALAAITLTVVIIAAVVVGKDRSPTYIGKETLLPALSESINEATSITLVSNRHKTILERDGETWRIANSDDYPALFDKVRSLLINLTELQTKERKTDNPELYHYLDVQDPSQPDSNSVQVTVTDKDGNVLADVIIGKSRNSKVTGLQTGLYARKPDAAHALLVEGRVPVSAEKTAWFNPDIVNIASERVREVIIRHPEGSIVHAYRESPEAGFQLADLPPNRRVQSRTALNRFGSVLQEISARDIRALETFSFDQAIETTVRTFGGMIIDIRSTRKDDRYYANFRFSFDADMENKATKPVAGDAGERIAVEAEAQELQERLGSWVYQIPAFKFEVLTATLDDYTRKVSGPDTDAGSD